MPGEQVLRGQLRASLPWTRATPAPPLGAGLGGHSAPYSLPFICWLCHFLSTLTLFLFSVISNNVTASLESIHQSRKQPMLTLIKKYHLCLRGRALSPTSGATPAPPPTRLPFQGVPRGNQIPLGAGCPPTGGAPTPAHSPERETGSERGLNLGGFLSAEELDLAIFPFSNGFFFIG